MNKKILFGSMLAVFLMMMLPTASAAEYSTVKETMKSQYPIIIPDIDIEELKLKYQNNPTEPTFIILFILTQIIRLLRMVKFTVLFALIYLVIKKIFGNSTTPIIS